VDLVRHKVAINAAKVSNDVGLASAWKSDGEIEAGSGTL
jgi:hypothetical protein